MPTPEPNQFVREALSHYRMWRKNIIPYFDRTITQIAFSFWGAIDTSSIPRFIAFSRGHVVDLQQRLGLSSDPPPGKLKLAANDALESFTDAKGGKFSMNDIDLLIFWVDGPITRPESNE